MKYYVDIDNTICRTEGNDYQHAVPLPDNIAKINKLFDSGNVVIYWTARGGTSGKNLFDLTHQQLLDWGCKFNSLWMDKPGYDVIIDDRALRIEEL